MDTTLLSVTNLTKLFPLRRRGFGAKEHMKAVDRVTFDVDNGEIVGLIGESGSGKTTVARCIMGLTRPTSGAIEFEGMDIVGLSGRALKSVRRYLQMIFQDPYESLSDRMRVFDIVREPLRFHGISTDVPARVAAAMDLVRLSPPHYFFRKYPHELSGGQRQRVATARALVLRPKMLICDEPTSMMDVSLRVGLLNVLLDLKEQHGLGALFVTHDLAVARYICDRIVTMYRGSIVEIGEAQDIATRPLHPYTQALASAMPQASPSDETHAELGGNSAPQIVGGCRYAAHCRHAMAKCTEEEPQLRRVERSRLVACFLYEDQ